MPERCPNSECGVKIASDRPDDEIVMPFIRHNGKTAAADKVYRDMERGSEYRAQAAAELAGTTVAEMSSLKITDLNDRKDSPIAAKEVHNDISRAMNSHPGVQGFVGSSGVSICPDVQAGAFPSMGARVRTTVQSMHAEMVSKHAVGLDADTRRPVVSTTNLICDRPSKETEQPGYRRRG